MRVLVATDAFPPNCGGSGWSTYELVRGLRARNHEIAIVQPRPGSVADAAREYDGFAVEEYAAPAPRIPFVRNMFKNERLWARLATRLAARATEWRADVIHAQHVLTAPAAVEAGRRSGVPVVCTVRDYWPVCYWATLIHDPDSPTLCPACSASMMTRCVRPRAGAAWPIALPFIPYMRGNLERRQRGLGGADAVIAVSSTIGRDLAARSAHLAAARLEVIPNPVDVAGLRNAVAGTRPPIDGPYAIFVGKLEINKGSAHLIRASEKASLPWPLVVVGDGAERPRIEADARRTGRDVRMVGWAPRQDALTWLAHASLLVFPSYGPESLSRVLLEAAALGVPIAAMDTGGTRDIIIHGRTGLLSTSAEGLGDDLARLVIDRDLASRLGASARAHVEATFAASRVVARIDQLYDEARRDG